MEHIPWIGPNYGRTDQRILIVGYSHHTEGEDDENLTVACGQSAANDSMPQPFFKRPPGYVGLSHDRARFWNSVAFINFVPCAIGGFEKKNDWASRDLHHKGYERLQRIIAQLLPSHIFVLTPKPEAAHYKPYRISDLGKHVRHTISIDDRHYDWLEMENGVRSLKIALLPHPQPSRSDHMQYIFNSLIGVFEG